jgi:hypothetical protein
VPCNYRDALSGEIDAVEALDGCLIMYNPAASLRVRHATAGRAGKGRGTFSITAARSDGEAEELGDEAKYDCLAELCDVPPVSKGRAC